MRPKVQVYLTADELIQLRREAGRRRMTLSRYAKERLICAQEPEVGGAALDGAGAAKEMERLINSVRKALGAHADGLAENLRTVMVMLDQLVLATLTHLPEIPAAQQQQRRAIGEQRHREWERQVEQLLRQLRAQTGDEQPVAAAGNGVQA